MLIQESMHNFFLIFKLNLHMKRVHQVPKKNILQQLTPKYSLLKLPDFKEKEKIIRAFKQKRPDHI